MTFTITSAPLIDPRDVTVLHLAVDWQENFLEYLPESERERLFGATNDFVLAIRTVLPTIFAAVDTKNGVRLHSGIREPRSEQENNILVRGLGLSLVVPKHWEDVFTKNEANAFHDGRLNTYLREHYPNLETIVITGMSTTMCVAFSVFGALINNYDCVALTDLLAEARTEGTSPEWHEEALRENVKAAAQFVKDYPARLPPRVTVGEIDGRMAKLRCMTTADFINEFKIKPEPAVKAAPVSELKDMRL